MKIFINEMYSNTEKLLQYNRTQNFLLVVCYTSVDILFSNGCHFGDDIFETRFPKRKCLFLRVQLTIFQHWFKERRGAEQATRH